MTDPMTLAQIVRAETALNLARSSMAGEDHRAKAKEFCELARCIARAANPNIAVSLLHAVHKAAAHTTFDEIWLDGDIQQMAQSFIASTAEPDILQAIGRYARSLTKFYGRVLVATGATGDLAAEGFPKLIRHLNFSLGSGFIYTKSVAACVISNELLNASGEAGRRMFETELEKAVVRRTNEAVTASLIDSNTTAVSAGTDPLASLRAGILAAGPSDGFVVSMPAGDVAWLSTCVENRGGMSVRGGEFSPGIFIAAIDDATVTTVIPASRLTYIDGGLELRPSGHATVDMSDDPEVEGEKVSLWQANCGGLLVERRWVLKGDNAGIVTVE